MMNLLVCRCCLKENPVPAYNIYDDCLEFWEELKICLPSCLHYEYNDGLPQIVCHLCWHQLHQFKNFRRQCLMAEQDLRNRYEDSKNQAVEEVLSLIEKLRQEDHHNVDSEICQEINFPEMDPVETSQLSSDFDSHSSSHDSGIFEDDCTQPSPNNFENLLPSLSSNSPASNFTLNDSGNKSAKCKSFKGPFACQHCDKNFTRNFQLKLHLISVHQIGDGLQYICQICEKTFASSHSLSYHQKSVHYQDKPHFCLQCERQFVLKSQLASHMRTHTGEAKPRIFECQECGKKWPTRSDLRTHMRSHDPNMERPFKCDRCEKSFFTRGHLTSHQLVHTGEKPFACEFCRRSYQSVGNLNNHMARRHVREIVNKEQNLLCVSTQKS